MKKNMKKVLAGFLAATMVMSMSVTAWADTTSNVTMTTKGGEVVATSIEKLYTVSGENESQGTIFPGETLTFTSVLKSYPDGADATESNLTVNDLTVTGLSNQKLLFTLPTYEVAGKYVYEITENSGTTQGVGYTGAGIAVTVLVGYDYDDNSKNEVNNYELTKSDGADGYGLVVEAIGVEETTSTGTKNDTFVNDYYLGSLAITKKVTGGLGNRGKEFDVKVTFKAAGQVASDISYNKKYNDQTMSTIEERDWNYESNVGTVSVDVTVKDGATINFYNIPDGVEWSVAEYDYTTVGDGINKANSNNGYDAPSYTTEDSSALSEQVIVQVIGEDGSRGDDVSVVAYGGKIETTETTDNDGIKTVITDADTITITNNKGTDGIVNTGILLDSAPYVLLLTLAGAGAAAVVSKKRRDEF